MIMTKFGQDRYYVIVNKRGDYVTSQGGYPRFTDLIKVATWFPTKDDANKALFTWMSFVSDGEVKELTFVLK
jgi:hypothetical protein